jgi:hypothetical protein
VVDRAEVYCSAHASLAGAEGNDVSCKESLAARSIHSSSKRPLATARDVTDSGDRRERGARLRCRSGGQHLMKNATSGTVAAAVLLAMAGCAAPAGDPAPASRGAEEPTGSTGEAIVVPHCPQGEVPDCWTEPGPGGKLIHGCDCVPGPPSCTPGPDRYIATVPMTTSFGSHAIVTSADAFVCGGYPEGCNTANILDFGPVTNASAGSVLWQNGANAHFGALTGLLTNGVNDPFSWSFSAGGGSGDYAFESTFFSTQGLNGFDLTGYAISWIGFRVDSISLTSPGSDPDHDGIWTDTQVSGAFLFWGNCAP